MAITPTYEHSSTMKKLNVNGSIYWLKDADLRSIVEGFSGAVYKDVDTTIIEDSVNLVTSDAIQDWVEEKIASLEGAMHFRGVIERQEGETDIQAISRVITDPKAGDVVIMKDNGKEYIYSGTAWEEVGDQNIYLTITAAKTTYTPLTRKIAGIDLQDDITVNELSASTALNLKALSHKDSASGTISTADSVSNISSGKAGTYTLAGDTVAVPATYSALDVTPVGTVSITAGTAAAATYEKATSATVAAGAVGKGQTANYTPAGAVTLPAMTTTVTMSTGDVATVTDAGTAYTLTDGSVVKAKDTTAKFVKKGVSIAMDATETEQLNLLYVANTDTDFYTDAVTAAGAITYTKQTISGALPTFGSKTVALDVATAGTTYNGSASFAGTGTVLTATLAHTTTAATVTQPTFTAGFTGTSKTVTPAVATTVDAQAPSGTITVPSETISLTLNKTDKTVTVS